MRLMARINKMCLYKTDSYIFLFLLRGAKLNLFYIPSKRSRGIAMRPCAVRTREILSDARKPGLYCVSYAVFNPEFISRQGSFIPGVVAAAFNGPLLCVVVFSNARN